MPVATPSGLQARRGPQCAHHLTACEGRTTGGTSAGHIPPKVTQHSWLAIWNILIAAVKRGALGTQH